MNSTVPSALASYIRLQDSTRKLQEAKLCEWRISLLRLDDESFRDLALTYAEDQYTNRSDARYRAIREESGKRDITANLLERVPYAHKTQSMTSKMYKRTDRKFKDVLSASRMMESDTMKFKYYSIPLQYLRSIPSNVLGDMRLDHTISPSPDLAYCKGFDVTPEANTQPTCTCSLSFADVGLTCKVELMITTDGRYASRVLNSRCGQCTSPIRVLPDYRSYVSSISKEITLFRENSSDLSLYE
jgi:hypothetical protein